jgi:hypothetical protein
MMNNNKILTVSYGTFSCTLEGFDDSFGTMKAIAEYFRDLAAEDRYFGAEPSQPDAEMLAHIAQKEISRRVEARRQDGNIVLSAREATGSGDIKPVEISRTDASRATAALSALATAQAPERGALAEATPNPTADVAEQASPAVANTTQDLAAVAAQPDAADPRIDLSEVDIVPGQPDDEIKAFFDESTASAETREHAEHTTADSPVNSSIAAKLQRIRSVVSRQDVDKAEDDYTEDEHADDEKAATSEKSGFVADAVKDIETALDEDDTAAVELQDEEDDVSALINRLDSQTQDDEQPQESITADDDGVFEDDVSGENLFDADTTPQEATADPETSPNAAAAARGRVIKVKRADLEKAIEKGDLEEYSGDDHVISETDPDFSDDALVSDTVQASQDDVTDEDLAPSSLTAAEEDELARELADVEAGVVHKNADAEPRRTLPSLEGDQGSDMNRLLAETDNQMDDPESAVRRDAISHLRAAVAAKKADFALGEPNTTDEEDDAYRNDLAEVVKPRRPVAKSDLTEHAPDARPAPLKLVAEQRINTQAAAPAAPVSPRRVTPVVSAPTTAEQVEGGFAEFADEMGATSLPDLLEAAAAYMSFVEGLDQFSRPQLMSTVRLAGEEDFSREEGLRSFGMLLRTGKLQKLDGGRFKVSDKIGYQPDERAAG